MPNIKSIGSVSRERDVSQASNVDCTLIYSRLSLLVRECLVLCHFIIFKIRFMDVHCKLFSRCICIHKLGKWHSIEYLELLTYLWFFLCIFFLPSNYMKNLLIWMSINQLKSKVTYKRKCLWLHFANCVTEWIARKELCAWEGHTLVFIAIKPNFYLLWYGTFYFWNPIQMTRDF